MLRRFVQLCFTITSEDKRCLVFSLFSQRLAVQHKMPALHKCKVDYCVYFTRRVVTEHIVNITDQTSLVPMYLYSGPGGTQAMHTT